MEKTLRVLNELREQRIIQQYAIGGAIAALFYMEPVLTYDLDVFIFLPPLSLSSGLITLSPIYEFLRKKGFREDKEHVIIEGIPVQFIPAYNQLVEEAVKQAREIKYKGTKTRVLRAEYLIAIMLQTDRAKDRARIIQLLEETSIQRQLLKKIINQHDLQGKWRTFQKKFHEK